AQVVAPVGDGRRAVGRRRAAVGDGAPAGWREVGAGAEAAAGTRDDNGPDLLVFLGVREGLRHARRERVRERVQLLRPVQRDDPYALLDFVDYVTVVVHLSSCAALGKVGHRL